jgi:FAD/FMN-containing dehydrogenase
MVLAGSGHRPDGTETWLELVAIGGHVQTGGYGHFLRSYGLALDHVSAFKIYGADGTLVTVSRPAKRDENSLYWGVIGPNVHYSGGGKIFRACE